MQVPYLVWQPVPQCPVVEPHHPYCEQQLPNVEPLHVVPAVEPQVPSVDTFVPEAAGAVEVFVEVAVPQVPKADWHPVPQ